MEFLRNLLVVLFILILSLFIYKKISGNDHVNKWRVGGLLLLTTTVIFVFTLTGITPASGFHLDIQPGKNTAISLVPFHTIRSFIKVGIGQYQALKAEEGTLGAIFGTLFSFNTGGKMQYIVANLGGNIIMFIPIGALVPLVFKKAHNGFVTLLVGFALSFLIEFSQLFTYRGTDIDDIILNVAGCMIGYLCFLIMKLRKTSLYKQFQKTEEYKYWTLYLPLCMLLPYFTVVLLGFLDRHYRYLL